MVLLVLIFVMDQVDYASTWQGLRWSNPYFPLWDTLEGMWMLVLSFKGFMASNEVHTPMKSLYSHYEKARRLLSCPLAALLLGIWQNDECMCSWASWTDCSWLLCWLWMNNWPIEACLYSPTCSSKVSTTMKFLSQMGSPIRSCPTTWECSSS